MRILGLDICKSSVVACLLTERPASPRQFYYDTEFYNFKADAPGIKGVLALEPTVAVLEPTGTNYSKLWVTKLAEAGVEVVLVGHKELHGYRAGHLDLPDKDDQADALALGCYWFDHHNSSRRFVKIRDPIIAKIRDIVLRLQHLNRVQSPMINRIRQDLAWQFPEVMDKDVNHAPLFWSWLAGEAKSKKYDALYEKTIGLGLQTEVRNGAKALREIKRREQLLEYEMRTLMKDVRFLAYRKVFAQFGFGQRVEALILSQIYPLENYLDQNGKPEVMIRKGKNSGKPTKRELSRRRFEKALGVAPVREESGDNKKTKKSGTALCRMALWQWIFTRIERKRGRLKTEIGQQLSEQLDLEKKQKPVRLARSRVASRAARLLFKELVKELVGGS